MRLHAADQVTGNPECRTTFGLETWPRLAGLSLAAHAPFDPVAHKRSGKILLFVKNKYDRKSVVHEITPG